MEQKRAYLASLLEVAAAGPPSFVVSFFDDLGWGGERDKESPLGPGGLDQSRPTETYTDEAIAFLEVNSSAPRSRPSISRSRGSGRPARASSVGRDDSPHEALFFFPVLDSLPGAVRSGRYKYLRSTGDIDRDRAHLSRVDADVEAHDLSRLYPAEAERLGGLLEAMRSRIEANPRGWIQL